MMCAVGRLLAVGLVLLSATASADWISRSDKITMEVLRLQGGFQPEEISSYGLTEFDTAIVSLKKDAREAEIASYRGQIDKLGEQLASEGNTRVGQDISILIEALQDQIQSSELNHALMIPYYNLHEQVFYSILRLIDERNDSSRYAAALERLRKYNGRAEGFRPITEQAKQRSTERFAVEGLTGPSRRTS